MAVPINAFASAHPLKLKFNALRSHVSIAESHVPQARPLNKPLIVASRHPLKTHQPISRRTALALLATLSVSPLNSMTQAASIDDFPYDSNKSRRYVDVGRPPPDRNAPAMKRDRPIFSIDDQLRAQDVTVGKGDPVKPGTLVIARWVAILDDGTTVDDANENLPAIFRPGAHQVPPGVEDAIVGMRSGGVRRIVGSSERILR